jgi:tetratricopeptide (TPR) repeat protein
VTDRLSPSDLLYEPLIAQYLGPGFVERTWLAGRVEQHFQDPECRFVLLTGGPGTGKSAFLAWLSRRHALSPRYFLRRLSSHPLASGDASSLLLSIGHQLAVLRPEMMSADLDVSVEQSAGHVAPEGRVVGVRVGILHISPFQHTAIQVEQHADVVEGEVVGYEIGRMVADPRLTDIGNLQNLALLEPAVRLAAKDPAGLVVVLIDALDELRFQFGGRGDIVEWLAECPELPRNLRIVVTCRPDRQLLQRFRLAQADRLREETIEPATHEVTGDLVLYAESVLSDPLLAGIRNVNPQRVAARAQGSFLYLVLWARGLRDAVQDGDHALVAALTDLAELPTGLAGIHEYFLALVRDTVRQREGQSWTRVWKRVYRRLLGVLAVAQASLSAEQLMRLGDLEDEREDVMDALNDLDQFLVEDEHGIRLYHLTLAELLVDTRRTRDDWHVDASQNHQRIAAELIAEHGGSWPACEDDYALGHTATHLVAAVQGGSRRAAGMLTELLGDPGFGLAKSLRLGVPAMLRDYLAANAVLPGDPDIAAGLAATLAQLVDQGVPDLSDTLHAYVGYRPDAAELNKQVLGLLSDPDHLARFVTDGTARASALIAFSHGQATRLRRTGELEQARQILVRAVSDKDLSAMTSPRLRSPICYELGYLDFLFGEPAKALEWFEQSVAAAQDAGNPVGAQISRLVALRVGLLSGAVSPAAYREAHEEALAYFTGPDADGPHAARWVMNIHAQLLDLGLWTGDTELIESSLRFLEEDPWIRENKRDDILLKYRARAAAATGAWTEARALFETLLDGAPAHQEELARDLYYYGGALAGAGDTAAAREAWERGLRCPDGAANWPWQPKIEAALRNTAHP